MQSCKILKTNNCLGGNTLCPGRFVAKQGIRFAVVSLGSRFNISIDLQRTRTSGKKIRDCLPPSPRLDTTKPSPGAVLPHEGDELVLLLKKIGQFL